VTTRPTRSVTCSAADRRVGLLIGPAGAGKTRTLRAVVDAWHHTGREVVGLTVSQAAAQVLTAEAHVRAENTAKWLHETRRGRWTLPPGALVLIDEASMVSTDTMVQLIEQARKAGGRVLLVGDPAQLAAIHIGGAFDLLADRHGAARLHEIRRFTKAGRPTRPGCCAGVTRPRWPSMRCVPASTAAPKPRSSRACSTPGRPTHSPMTAGPGERADDRGHQRPGRRARRTRTPHPHRPRRGGGWADRAAAGQPRLGGRPHRHPPQRPPAHHLQPRLGRQRRHLDHPGRLPRRGSRRRTAHRWGHHHPARRLPRRATPTSAMPPRPTAPKA
jgi:hypothetical protein